MTYYMYKDTPAGKVLLVGDKKSVSGIYWKVFKRIPKVGSDWVQDEKVFQKASKELDEYFAGKRKKFTFAYSATGTDFQKKVWAELEKIPFGKSLSYKDIAAAIGSPKAVRAVGTAVGSNPISITVPCHRVLAVTGKIGRFAGGPKAKEVLLRCEKVEWKV
jgi:methylated-DNA-[protein]-cysteine S-methyltransferase